MSGKYIPAVSDFSIFREVASNISNPLEIIREAISNSDDANANKINICIDRNLNGQLTISIEDNGDGMDIDGIHKFFNLGFSDKSINKIGEKGVGTKIFYKSEEIYIETHDKEGNLYIADMLEPWEKLKNNIIPEYIIQKFESDGKRGTKVVITSYKADSPENFFNLESVKDYIQWFTIGGSFRNIFANKVNVKKQINNIDIVPQIIIEDRINEKSELISGIHQFEEPNENIKGYNFTDTLYTSDDYARTFGPYIRETNINGEYVSVQIYGTVSGMNAKRKICSLNTEKEYKSRFGLYLCKDFIPCVKMDELLDTDEYYHYHIVANSQNFKLTADRNNISNIDDVRVKWVMEQISQVVNKEIKPIANREYFMMKKKEEDLKKLNEKYFRTKKNIKQVIKSQRLGVEELGMAKVPKNELETALIFASILSNLDYKQYIPMIKYILSYSNKTSTDMVCLSNKGENILVEIELKLKNFLNHNHPIETVDYIVCWNVNLEENHIYKMNNKSCIFVNSKERKYLMFDEKELEVIELKSIIKQIINESERVLC
ncbi:ATP-binding protein [Terrisporobacter sp.]|uniref:ATP-binding protein n=1 Tax=Terrisporobacter sp. TaxID=1965305 RepID=UPI002603A165|nr:ATP-binding protein [Terrisporobacter sp.]